MTIREYICYAEGYNIKYKEDLKYSFIAECEIINSIQSFAAGFSKGHKKPKRVTIDMMVGNDKSRKVFKLNQ
jgi:hypothetical protein